MRKKLFVITYNHKYGTDSYIVQSEKQPTEEQVIKTLKLDFEPDKNEWIAVQPAGRILTIKN